MSLTTKKKCQTILKYKEKRNQQQINNNIDYKIKMKNLK